MPASSSLPPIQDNDITGIVPNSRPEGDLREICDQLWARVSAFLQEDDQKDQDTAQNAYTQTPPRIEVSEGKAGHVRRARAQTRVSLDVIEDALHRYRSDKARQHQIMEEKPI